MTPTELQAQLDGDFPSGLVLHYNGMAVPVATVTVIGEQDESPLVLFWDLESTKSWQDTITSYTEVQREPCVLVRAKSGSGTTWEFSGNISGELEQQALRQRDSERRWALDLQDDRPVEDGPETAES